MKKLLLLLAVIANLAFAAPAPEELVRASSKDVVEILKKKNDKKAREQVEARVLPNFDFNRMTALAVGRHWRSATPEQKRN